MGARKTHAKPRRKKRVAGSPTVHLVDGHVYIFRSYFALPEMYAPDGTATHAAYGFANSLLKFSTEAYERGEDPLRMGVCFDHAMTSFRNEIEPGYKAQRGEPDDELEAQFGICREVASALGFPVYEARDFEADDVIATLAEGLLDEGARVRVLTSDKDLAQLVREDGSSVLGDLAHHDEMDADAVREKFGVSPAQIPDYLGLVGDAVDNLPGVAGIGAKTAAALLGAYPCLEAIPDDVEKWEEVEVRGARRVAEKLAAGRERALLTKQLATVRRDVPGLGDAHPDAFIVAPAQREVVEPLFERLGWGRIAERVPRWL